MYLPALKIYTERTISLEGSKILLAHQKNFIGVLKIMSDAEKNFDILANCLRVLHNYFDSSTKSLSDLYPVKILDPTAKLFFLGV